MSFHLVVPPLAAQHPPGFTIKDKYNTISLNTVYTDDALIASESMIAWNKHFASGFDGQSAIQVPLDWVNFICSTLLTPDKFDWAKMFFNSPMWHVIKEGTTSKDSLDFFIPDSCPVNMVPLCSQAPTEEERNISTRGKEVVPEKIASSSSLHLQGKRKDRAPIVGSEVRRSERLHQLNKGFRKKDLSR